MTVPATISFRDAVEAIRDDLVRLRRDVHADPEIGMQLPRTQQKILAALEGLPLEITLGRALSSVVAVLRGGLPGPTVLLRGDMDALPVQESNGLDYISKVPGTMHACGHDLHVAGLVGAARLLCQVRDELPGNVVFMFQPGEESPGGAAPMIAEGLLDVAGSRVDAAYTIHVSSGDDEKGMFTTRRGSFMAAADTLKILVRGEGGHGSTPHRAKDPIPAACEMVGALETFVTRNIDIWDPVVLTVGQFHSGTADNIIPPSAMFEATIRSFSPESRAIISAGVVRMVQGIADAHGLDIDINYEWGYPVTVNDDAEAEFAAAAVREVFGEERFSWMTNPIPGSEDFSFVLEQVPGAYLNLGACPPDLDPATAPMNHSPLARFDDEVVPDAAVLLAELARRRMLRG
ncbi:MAG TPA: M20 family metallopeptidase [Micromonosporaceae bacterium]|nr:M20 family metallopeptidase [Micromonosporaceae bacterium]